MIDDFKALLEKYKYLPFPNAEWKCIKLKFDTTNQSAVRKMINKTFTENGVYILVDLDGVVQYIGKGTPVSDRIGSHFRKMYAKEKEGNEPPPRVRFFKTLSDREFDVYWKQYDGEYQNIAIEAMLQFILKPYYDSWDEHEQKEQDTNQKEEKKTLKIYSAGGRPYGDRAYTTHDDIHIPEEYLDFSKPVDGEQLNFNEFEGETEPLEIASDLDRAVEWFKKEMDKQQKTFEEMKLYLEKLKNNNDEAER